MGDVILSNHRAVILIKWSKTFQERVKSTTIDVPQLCPVKALTHMITAYPSDNDSPLFQIHYGHAVRPLTDSDAMKHLKYVSSLLGLSRSLTFHDFRRGGASWAFKHGVPDQNIQAQDTWSSNCVWRYITPPPPFSGGYYL